ncbi:MAG: glycosyltransferase family 2 protein [Lachnospiraceae bacterium]|nr:glycosyltransferase family 2 protein [Lachnospiraceae bacterium]
MAVQISFIIPVYNGARDIGPCIRAIQKWDGKEAIEIIVVDDGSTDDTGKVCDKAAEYDSRIHVVHIENSGQGIARNQGIAKASGKYLYFVDADDRVCIKAIYKMWQKAELLHTEVIMGGYYRVCEGKKERIHPPEEGFVKRGGKLYHALKQESMFGYVWNKLYLKNFLQKHNLWLDDIRKINMEDYLFNIKVWSKNPVFYCVDYPVYTYIADQVSTTRRADSQIHKKSVAMLRILISYLEEHKDLDTNMDMVVPLIMRSFCWSMIKNVPYEGLSFDNLTKRANTFMDSKEIQRVLKKKRIYTHIQSLPSKLQCIFYSLCLFAIKHKMVGCVSMGFYIFYPIMKRYAASVLK